MKEQFEKIYFPKEDLFTENGVKVASEIMCNFKLLKTKSGDFLTKYFVAIDIGFEGVFFSMTYGSVIYLKDVLGGYKY
tara:strand:+ start:487 stop:720 length:234 start_codon:yes stop_codon:yes gene_type:complete